MPRLLCVLTGVALFQLLAPAASFAYDGSSSDLAQKFRDLYDDTQGDANISLVLTTIPSDIQARLAKYSFTFEDLPSCLQRALVWDAGYVVSASDGVTTLATIYTQCNSSMADISLSLVECKQTGCKTDTCSDPYNNNATTYRALNCTAAQMAPVSRCASTNVLGLSNSSMWATGGNTTFVPMPNVARHNSNGSGLMYAIHMIEAESFHDTCPTDSSYDAMVIPCVPYESSAKTEWCRPTAGAVVDDWLSEGAKKTGKSPLLAPSQRPPPNISVELKAYIEMNFTYDGRSSDLARQFLIRYAAGDQVDQLKIPELPKQIQDRLSPLGLKFKQLDGLLQRALVWDSGFVLDKETTLTPVLTKDNRSMAEIALLRAEYETQCTTKTCHDGNGGYSHRSQYCNGTQMEWMAYCAMTTQERPNVNVAMWADGGTAVDIPNPRALLQTWPQEGQIFNIPAIHTGNLDNEPSWGNCQPTNAEYYGAMIVPCRTYESINDISAWSKPQPGALVDAWLKQASEDSKTWLHWWLILLFGLIVSMVVAAGLWGWRTKRQERFSIETPDQPISLMTPKECAVSAEHEYLCSDIVAAQAFSMNRTQSTGYSVINRDRGASAWDAVRILSEDPVLALARIPLEALQLDHILAKGGFGEVWMGFHYNKPVAIKKLLSSKQQFEFVQGFIEEIQLTSSFDHPNIIRFVGIAWSTLENLCMVVEYLETGDLQMFLQRNNDNLSWTEDKYSIALGIARGVAYLHTRRPAPLIHRDIKAKNVLLTSKLQPKLIDFGVSRDRALETMTAGVGTPYWAAPEVLEGGRYTEQSDIYSFGILLSEMDTAETPFTNIRDSCDEGLSAFQVLNLVLAGKIKPKLTTTCPEEIITTMNHCLNFDPKLRPTASQLVDMLMAKVNAV